MEKKKNIATKISNPKGYNRKPTTPNLKSTKTKSVKRSNSVEKPIKQEVNTPKIEKSESVTKKKSTVGEINSFKDNKVINMIGMELHDIISKYIICISLLSIEPFLKIMKSENQDALDFLRKSWNVDKISRFVAKTFFKDNYNFNARVDLTSFLFKNLDSLSDDVALRKSLMNFQMKKNDVY